MAAKEALQEAESYITAAELLLQQDLERWNPVAVNGIMAMIRTIDAAWLYHFDAEPEGGRGHEKTSKNLQALYDQQLIDTSFQANVDSVKYWVDQKKSAYQYKGEYCSRSDAETCLTAAKRLFQKMQKELL